MNTPFETESIRNLTKIPVVSGAKVNFYVSPSKEIATSCTIDSYKQFAIVKNDLEALHNYAVYQIEKREKVSEAMGFLKEAAEQGYLKSNVKLCRIYNEGVVVARNRALAEKFHNRVTFICTYLLAYQNNDIQRWFELGNLYSEGKGVEKSEPLAFECFHRSWLGGNKKAGKIVANMLIKKGIKDKAFNIYKQFVKEGDLESQEILAKEALNSGDKKSAIAQYEDLSKEYKRLGKKLKSQKVLTTVAHLLEELGDNKKALEIFVSFGSDKLAVLEKIAYLAEKVGEDDKALSAFERLATHNKTLLTKTAQVAERLGENKKALSYYEMSAKNDIEARKKSAYLSERLGYLKKAIAHYKVLHRKKLSYAKEKIVLLERRLKKEIERNSVMRSDKSFVSTLPNTKIVNKHLKIVKTDTEPESKSKVCQKENEPKNFALKKVSDKSKVLPNKKVIVRSVAKKMRALFSSIIAEMDYHTKLPHLSKHTTLKHKQGLSSTVFCGVKPPHLTAPFEESTCGCSSSGCGRTTSHLGRGCLTEDMRHIRANYSIVDPGLWFIDEAETYGPLDDSYLVQTRKLGQRYDRPGSYDFAFSFYKMAAAIGDAVSQYALARFYSLGLGGAKVNDHLVGENHRKAMRQGYPPALMDYANIYVANGDFLRAASYLKGGAIRGNKYFQNALGVCYYLICKDFKEKLDEMGNAGLHKNSYTLEDRNYYLRSYKHFRRVAFKFLHKAAIQKYSTAIYNLSVMYAFVGSINRAICSAKNAAFVGEPFAKELLSELRSGNISPGLTMKTTFTMR